MMESLYNLLTENSIATIILLFVLLVLGNSQLKNTDDEDHYNNLNG